MTDCPSGKVGHRSQAAARRAAIAVGMRRTHDRPRTYHCPYCHAWHLTTAPRYIPTRGRRRGRPAEPSPATPAEVDAWFAQHHKSEGP